MHRFLEEAWNQNNVADLDEYVAASALVRVLPPHSTVLPTPGVPRAV